MYGLIGKKLGHSYSKLIHEMLSDNEYSLIELADIDDFFKQKKFKAVNVTIPYKEKVIPYLDEIDPKAQQIGAINCVVNNNGKLTGYNTDYLGFKYLLEKNDIQIKDKKVIILGDGGTSKTVRTVVKDLKALEIIIISRKGLHTYADLDNYLDFEVIINTTPVGMYPDLDQCLIDLSKFKKCESVVDVIYNPLNTLLIQNAKKLKLKAVSGLQMLVAQAIFASEIFLNVKYEASVFDEIYQKILKQMLNIVLIGMPGCGKSTLSQALNEKYGKKLIDLDAEIEKSEHLKIKDIFALHSEAYFREKETEQCRNFGALTNQIIATGGGVVKNLNNMRYLKYNSLIIFIDRDVDKLSLSLDRPLSQNSKDNLRLYQERYELYCKYCDVLIKNNDSIENAIKLIEEHYENFGN